MFPPSLHATEDGPVRPATELVVYTSQGPTHNVRVERLAPKGRDMKAQGNALGKEVNAQLDNVDHVPFL